MRIAIIAPVEERVPPPKYGGTELVVYNLVEELVKMGHEVTLFASGDSQTNAKLHPISPKATRTIPEFKNRRMRDTFTLIAASKAFNYIMKNKKNFDVVHNHLGHFLVPFISALKIPAITTLHGHLTIPNEKEVFNAYKKENYTSISMSQRKLADPDINFVANVYNGIDTDKFEFFPTPKDYFAFLGRFSPEKGPVQAIEIAKRAGVRLIMAGKVDPIDFSFFRRKVRPLIDREQIFFIGEIGHKEKVDLLGNAKGLLAPIQWEEPFGLYFIESMICGTPVIANKRGSVPEIIIDGKTGFAVESIDEAVKKIADIENISRLDCRLHTKENFSAKKMALNYLVVYEKILKNKKLNRAT